MNKRAIAALLFLVLLFALSVVQASQTSFPEKIDVQVKNFPETQQVTGEVQIKNFPETQQVRGSVSVEGTAKFIKTESVVVPTARRTELSELIYAGSIDTDGFTSMSISLQGELRSDVFSSGTIGVLLIPDEKPILRVFRDARRIQFPIECSVNLKSSDPVYFEAEQVHKRIAFSRYRIYFYNTGNKSVEANLYLYLSN